MKKTSTFFYSFFLILFVSISQLAFTQAPNWAWNSPMAVIPSTIGGTGLSIYAMLDRPGTIYYVVLSHGSAAPSVAQVAAGKDGLGNTPILNGSKTLTSVDYKSGFKSIEMNPLAASTEYDVYLAAKDTATSAHFQASPYLLDVTTTPGSGLTYWNGGFEQWNDSVTMPLYYYSWRQTLPNRQTYSQTVGESGYGLKTTVTNTSLSTTAVILDMQQDPFSYGLSNGLKYHVSLRLKASRANVFSVAFKGWAYFTDFSVGSGNPSAASSLSPDTLKSTNWTTYSSDFTITTANRLKVRLNLNKMTGVQIGDNVIVDNFYIKKAADAPLWWNGNPSISNINFNKFDVSLSLDEAGIVFYVVVPKNATAPSVSDVVAGKAAGGTAAITNGNINAVIGFNTYSTTIFGLAENKNYDIYFVAQNKESLPTNQAAATKVSALTTAYPGPFAKAGGTIWAISGYTVMLDGTGSIKRSGSNGTNLKFNWSAPAAILLSDSTVSKPTFTAPAAADTSVYSVILVVSDSINVSPPDTAVIHVVHDYPPIANGGGNKIVDPGANVSLDGSQSFDPNGNSITYTWVLPSLDTVRTASLNFVAPSPLKQTNYTYILWVEDGVKISSPDTVILTVKKFNLAPSADAGNDKLVDPSATVMLDGSACTDPNGDKLSYHWTIPAGITVANADTFRISFAAPSPDVKTSYKFILVVNDGLLDSSPDTVVVTVKAIYHKPTVNAGPDQTVNAGDPVFLSGSYSADSTGIPPAYSWTIPNGITVAKTDTSVISFTAPSPANTTHYMFILVVNDGLTNSNPDTVVVTVTGTVGIHSASVQEVQVYPNPVTSNLNIKLSGNWSFNANVRIYNAIGTLSLEKKMDGREYQLDMSSLPSGIYFLDIKDGQNSISRKLIKR